MIVMMKEEAWVPVAAARVKARAGVKTRVHPHAATVLLPQAAARAEAVPIIRAGVLPACQKKKCVALPVWEAKLHMVDRASAVTRAVHHLAAAATDHPLPAAVHKAAPVEEKAAPVQAAAEVVPDKNMLF